MAITRPVSGQVTYSPMPTVDVFNPPAGAGLTPAVGDNTTDDKPAVQAALDYVKAAHGGGRVVVSKPNVVGVRFLSGLTIPAKVQLVSDEATLFNFSGLPANATAITVNDTNFTPVVGVRMDGGKFTVNPVAGSETTTGISVTGVNTNVEKVSLQYFGTGIDLAHQSTFLNTFTDCRLGRCDLIINADIEGRGVGNAGERWVFRGCVLANSTRAYLASANGCHLRFEDCSIDFCTEIGKVNNATVHHSGHIETNSTPHLFDVTGNSQMFFSKTTFVLGKCVLFKTGQGPSNYGFGAARFDNCGAYFTTNLDVGTNRKSEELLSWPANTTTITLYVPWPLKWCAITADFCFNDGVGVPNADKVLVSSMVSTTGALTLTAPTNAAARWVRVKF